MSEKSKIIIRPEIPNEYEIVNQVIYKAFAEQHGMEIGKFMMEHFVEERQKETFIPDLSLVAVFLGGNSKLYSRYGFESSCKYGIYHKDREKWGDEGYMVCVLRDGAFNGVTGTTSYYGG